MSESQPNDSIRALRSLLARYVAVRQKREALEPQFDKLKEQEEQLAATIHEEMEKLEMKSMKLDRFGIFIRSSTGPWCSIKKPEEGQIYDEFSEDSREMFEKWTKTSGNESFIKPMPIFPRVNSYVKAALSDGRPLPPGIQYRFTRGVTWAQRTDKKGKKRGQG